MSSSASRIQPVDRRKRCLAVGQRAGLVDHQRLDVGKHFQAAAALDQHADARRPRHAGDDRHRHRQDQRAGGCHHHHRQPAHRVAGGEPRRAGDGERRHQEQDGEAVGEPRDWRALAGRLLDQPDDAGIGALRRRPPDDQVEGLAGIGGAAHHLAAGRPAHRQRLAGQRRLVEHRLVARGDGAVGRHHLAAAHQHAVAHRKRLDRHLLQFAVLVAQREFRRALEQCRHLAAGAARRIALEELAAGIHQRHDHAGERLAERQRPGHREQRHDVEADLPVPERDDDLADEHQHHRHGRRRPHRPGEVAAACGLRRQPERQSERRYGDQHMPDSVDDVACLHDRAIARRPVARFDPRQVEPGAFVGQR